MALKGSGQGALLGLLLLSGGLSAVEPDAFERAVHEEPVQAFHPNYIAVVSDHDETRAQFLLSLKYPLIPLAEQDWRLLGYRLDAVDLAYDGLFDFYLWTRDSQPLISRLQNPGLFLELTDPSARMDELQAGWFHESDGQVIHTIEAYQAGLGSPGPTDAISRAWDYWYLSTRFRFQPGASVRLSFSPSLHLFTGAQGIVLPAEQDIFWHPQDPPTYISDYDGLRAALSVEWLLPHRALNYVRLSQDLRTGYNSAHFAQNWSGRTALSFKTWHLPWTLFYDQGYGPYDSDYSTWSQGWGLGLQFWD